MSLLAYFRTPFVPPMPSPRDFRMPFSFVVDGARMAPKDFFKRKRAMNAINVKREALLDILKTNRESHRAIFIEAQAGYRTAVIEQLDSMLADARAGKLIRRSVTLIEPMDQTKDYDRAIQMLAMSVDDVVNLEEHDFQCYVMDEWSWKKQWTLSNAGYSQSLSATMGQ